MGKEQALTQISTQHHRQAAMVAVSASRRAVVWLFLATLLSSPLLTGGQQPVHETHICLDEGWGMMQIFDFMTERTQPPQCYIVRKADSFESASSFCHRHHAHLFRLDRDYQSYVTADTQNTLLFILARNGIEHLWHGYYVGDDRLLQDRFPMTKGEDIDEGSIDLLSQSIPWDSAPGTPEPSGTSKCFEVSVNLTAGISCPEGGAPQRKRRSLSLVPETAAELKAGRGEAKERRKRQTECQDRRVLVKSRPCPDRLPFVCVKPAIRRLALYLFPLPNLCRPGEVGYPWMPHCFRGYREGVDHVTARNRCEDMLGQARPGDATLYHATGYPAVSLVNSRVTVTLSGFIGSETRQEPVLRDPLAWVGGAEDNDTCLAADLAGATVAWDCTAKLPLRVCQRRITPPGVGNLTINVSNTTIPGMQISAIGSDGDRQVSVPFSSLTSPLKVVCQYYAPTIADLQSVALVVDGDVMATHYPVGTGTDRDLPVTVEMELKRDISYNETDYYWCEVNDLRTGTVRRSSRLFIRRAETKMIYAVSIAANPSNLPQSAFILDSLTGLTGEASRSVDVALAGQESGFRHRILRFRPETKPDGSNRTIMDFHFYGGDFGEFLDGPVTEFIRFVFFSEVLNFDLDSLQIRSTDFCPATSVFDPVTNRTYRIGQTSLGFSYSSPTSCLSNGLPFVLLNCEGDKMYGAQWSQFSPNPGCDFTSVPTSPSTDTLRNISRLTVTDDNVDGVIDNATKVVSTTDTFVPVDIVYIADIVQKAADVDSISPETAEKILELADVVTDINDKTLNQSNTLGNATNRIIKAIGDVGQKVDLGDNTNVRLVTRNTALEVWNVSKVTGDIIIGLELLSDGTRPVRTLTSKGLVSLFEQGSPSYTETDAAIFLHAQFVRKISEENAGKDVRLTMNVFGETALFEEGRLEGSLRRVVLNSKVISSKLTVDGEAITDLKNSLVMTVFLPTVRLPVEEHAGNSTCVFWDFLGAGGQGAWSEEGCRYNATAKGRDVCVCDHLTNFAVLLDLYGQSTLPQEQQLALSVITIVGLSLSIAGLSISVLSFLLIKKLRQGRPQQTLFNMALAMLASWIIFLAGFTRVEDHAGCIAVAALLHYFILASFMWMLMEGILQYLLFVKILGNDFNNYMVKTAVPAWGLPLIPVVIVLAIDTDLYRGGDQYCWMSLTPFYYAFLAPVCLVILANIVIYVMVVVNICRRGKVGNTGSYKRAVGIRASIACFIVLGLTWVFAFFAIDDARVVFQYLFTITSSLQGLLIFLIFTARDPTVRSFWRDVCCRCLGSGKSESDRSKMTPAGQQKGRGLDNTVPLKASSQSSSNGDDRQNSNSTSPSNLSSDNSNSYPNSNRV